MKKVSIIVPAYNAHDTLARCLGSLVNQTLQDIEIVVVNDASTDDTWEIMTRCEQQFPDKVIIINGDVNRGPGGARNQGLDVASGEYIGFVDSDDYVATNMYEKLYKRAVETNSDIVDSGFYNEGTDKALLTASDDLTGALDDNKRSGLIVGGGYLVTKLFRRALFADPHVRMREHALVLEDFEILIYMYLRARSLETVKEIFYCYCDTSGSGSKTDDIQKYYSAVCGAISATYDLCRGTPSYVGCKEAVDYMYARLYSYGINRCLYDHISKYGADIHKVGMYFDSADEKELNLMKNLYILKSELTDTDYCSNNFIKNRISELDIRIMQECDRRFSQESIDESGIH